VESIDELLEDRSLSSAATREKNDHTVSNYYDRIDIPLPRDLNFRPNSLEIDLTIHENH